MMPLFNTAVMVIFASRSRSRSSCPLIDFWAIIDIFEVRVLVHTKRSPEGKEEADSSSFTIICLSIVSTTNSC